MIIYTVTNKINGKQYIGQTTKSVEQRWKAHIKNAKTSKNSLLHKAMRKYGVENFEIEEMAIANNLDEMNAMEVWAIKQFWTLAPNGYNLDKGGRSHHSIRASKEGNKKISKSLLGNQRGKGIKLTPEHKAKLLEVNLGNQYSLGYTHSALTRSRMSIAHGGSKTPEDFINPPKPKIRLRTPRISGTYTHNVETRERMSKAKMGNKNSLGHKHSEKTKSQMSDSAKKRWERERSKLT